MEWNLEYLETNDDLVSSDETINGEIERQFLKILKNFDYNCLQGLSREGLKRGITDALTVRDKKKKAKKAKRDTRLIKELSKEQTLKISESIFIAKFACSLFPEKKFLVIKPNLPPAIHTKSFENLSKFSKLIYGLIFSEFSKKEIETRFDKFLKPFSFLAINKIYPSKKLLSDKNKLHPIIGWTPLDLHSNENSIHPNKLLKSDIPTAGIFSSTHFLTRSLILRAPFDKEYCV